MRLSHKPRSLRYPVFSAVLSRCCLLFVEHRSRGVQARLLDIVIVSCSKASGLLVGTPTRCCCNHVCLRADRTSALFLDSRQVRPGDVSRFVRVPDLCGTNWSSSATPRWNTGLVACRHTSLSPRALAPSRPRASFSATSSLRASRQVVFFPVANPTCVVATRFLQADRLQARRFVQI